MKPFLFAFLVSFLNLLTASAARESKYGVYNFGVLPGRPNITRLIYCSFECVCFCVTEVVSAKYRELKTF